MLLIPTLVKPSAVHGKGVFCIEDVKKGTVVWHFNKLMDVKLPLCHITASCLHFCYINPDHPETAVLCLDNARFWNFGGNCGPNGSKTGGEYDILALRDIAAGEELLILPESDLDAKRKLSWHDLEQASIPS